MPLMIVEVLNTSTRELSKSATNSRVLTESKATPEGFHIPDWVVATVKIPKAVTLGWPNSLAAFLPFVMFDVFNTSTRVFRVSATNSRLFTESKATPEGLYIPDWVVTGL